VGVNSGFTLPWTWPVAAPPNGVEVAAPNPGFAAGVEPKTPPAGAALPKAVVVAGRAPKSPPPVAEVVDAPNAGAVEVVATGFDK
jgi:hypothetical protein